MNPAMRKLIRQIIFIVWILGFYLLLGLILFDFKPFPVSTKSLYTLTGILLITYIAMGAMDDKY